MTPGGSTAAKFWFSGATSPFALSCFVWCPGGQAPNQTDSSARLVEEISSGLLVDRIKVQDIGLGGGGGGGGAEVVKVAISSGVMYNLTYDGKGDGHGHDISFTWDAIQQCREFHC